MISDEEWRVIPGYSKYQASTKGNIRNIKTKHVLKPATCTGYLRVSLYLGNGTKKQYYVHKLIAITFITNPENKLTVNHIDYVKKNNSVSNLEWATVTEQNRHKRKFVPIKHGEKKTRAMRIAMWRIDAETGAKLQLYANRKLAARWVFDNGLSSVPDCSANICNVYRGSGKKAFGFSWRYDTEDDTLNNNEIWKDIPPDVIGSKCGYQISTCGRVKTSKGRIKRGYIQGHGYLSICINYKYLLIHRIVAIVFLPNPENLPVVNHLDGQKNNAHVENLEWTTFKGNSQHAYDTGLHPETQPVIQYDPKTLEEICIFSNQTEAGRQLGISQNTINTCCVKKGAYTAGGFGFRLQKDGIPKCTHEIKTTKKRVIQYDKVTGEKIAVFESLANTAQQLGLWSSNIGSCCNKKQKTTGGFGFKFESEK
jgi:hypothetical protein